MLLVINPYYLASKKHKWSTFHANMLSFTSLPLPSTKMAVRHSTQITRTRDYKARVTRSTLGNTPRAFEKTKIPKGWFWFRKWDMEDVACMCSFVVIHALAACAPFHFNWRAFRLALGLGLLSGFGVTLGYHRLLCHCSFTIPKWLEYFFVYFGAHAFQRDPMFYVNAHKNHHKYADTNRDTVSPSDGFWFCNMGWFFYNDNTARKCGESRGGEYSKVTELKAQWFYKFLHDTYFWHPIALAALLYVHGGFPYLAWAMGMRAVVVHHFASLATYVSHKWGERPWNTPNTSTNNWWVAVLTLGEGWHNNHHTFPMSARHGLEWWQFDPTWELIKFLQLVGLARDIKLPTEAHKRRISFHWPTQKNKASI